MKYLTTIIINVFILQLVCAQDHYTWYKGNKFQLHQYNKKLYILFNSKINDSLLLNKYDTSEFILHSSKSLKPKHSKTWVIVEKKNNNRFSSLPLSNNILYVGHAYGDSLENSIVVSEYFYVKLKNLTDTNKLKLLSNKYKVNIVKQNRYMPNWYVLKCNSQSEGDALEMANVFYENGDFQATHPNFMIPFKTNSVCNTLNDPKWLDQWNLNNTGQYSGQPNTDIKMCDAWDVTKGDPNVKVAVFDEGVRKTHPDLGNISTVSFDCINGGPSRWYGDHGTEVTGIINAQHNNIGLAGIAPNCELVAISHDLKFMPPSGLSDLADGFNFAMSNNVDIINCSFGARPNSPYLNRSNESILKDAIVNCLTNGRNGLGTVIVFSSGNPNSGPYNNPSYVWYPAEMDDSFLVVGAIDQCGYRISHNSSCNSGLMFQSAYGDKLDIVAPGILINTTTGSSNYRHDFDATSSAAPHVTGIAALILSQNPQLTNKEVCDIIELTAQKMRNTY